MYVVNRYRDKSSGVDWIFSIFEDFMRFRKRFIPNQCLKRVVALGVEEKRFFSHFYRRRVSERFKMSFHFVTDSVVLYTVRYYVYYFAVAVSRPCAGGGHAWSFNKHVQTFLYAFEFFRSFFSPSSRVCAVLFSPSSLLYHCYWQLRK